MDRIQATQIFTRVVETNTFNQATEALSPSSMAGNIKNLEAFLGVMLRFASNTYYGVDVHTHD